MKLSARRCEAVAIDIARKLVAEGMVSSVTADLLAPRLMEALIADLSVEDRLNDEVRELLARYQDQMRDTGADYHEAFKKAKAKLARDRKLVL